MRVFKRLLLVFFFVSACARSPVKEAQSPTDPQGELNLLVQQFSASADPEQSESLLKEIKNQKGASVETLERLIQSARLYPPKALVGPLHLPVQVDDEAERYALYVPDQYNPETAYPLIVCLHGAGFTGDSYLERWQARLGEKSILACPTIENGAWWAPEAEALIFAVIDSVASKYNINPNQIYLTGMSNGGIGTYLIGAFHADRFAAIAPMAGGIPDEVFPILQNLRSTGVYMIHGAKDEVMPVTLSRKISDYLKGQGIEYTYREHTLEHPVAGGHFFPKEELPALVTWLQGQRRNPDPARVVSVRDREHLGPFYWTEINKASDEVADVLGSIFDRDEAERVRKGAFATLTAEVHDNRVEVKSEGVQKYTLFLNRRLIDFSRPVVVVTNGRKSFEGRLSERVDLLLKETKRRGDPGALYTASVEIDLTNGEK